MELNSKKIIKAAKKAGITISSGKGSHIKFTAPCGATFALKGHGKDQSPGVARNAWRFIAGDYERAY